jgi:Zn-dependent protease with chaperone function
MISGAVFKIIKSDKRTTYAAWAKIILTTGFIQDCKNKKVSYEHFEADVLHEIKHLNQWSIVLLFILATVASNLLLFIINCYYVFVWVPFLYLLMCWLIRLLEYDADRYAARFVSEDAMRHFLIYEGERMDQVPRFLYVFRLHPSASKRLKRLERH